MENHRFSQRRKRRVWLNLDDVLESCNRRFNKNKIVCIEINLERPASHTLQQVVVHGALDALVGVHGSGLAQAAFLSAEAYLLELVPWIPRFSQFGRGFIRTTHADSNIGRLLTHSTDLNHVGIPLERDSAAHICQETSSTGNRDDVDDDACLRQHIDELGWAIRDFSVDFEIVNQFVQRFVIEPPAFCSDFDQRQLDEFVVNGESRAFVMYNIHCLTTTTTGGGSQALEHQESKTCHWYTNRTIVEDETSTHGKPKQMWGKQGSRYCD
jgi:hypothetical protein